MFRKFLRYITFSSLLLAVIPGLLTAQPCADTQPVITGTQVVSNNQTGVIYSTPDIPGHTYSWSITGGTIMSGGNSNTISVNWGVVGAGTLTLTETNPSIPCQTQVTRAIRIQPLLVAYFYYRDTTCYGDKIWFYDTSVYDPAKPIISWHWSFGDGSTSNVQNPIHTYLLFNATYHDTLIVTNNEGFKDTIIDAVYVNPFQFVPTAAYTYTLPSCSYQPVNFDASGSTTPPLSGPFIHYYWDFGDPASGVSNIIGADMGVENNFFNVNHIFSGPGTYTVTLTITNKKYCIGTITHDVVVDQSVPSSKFSFSSPTCENNPVSFSDLSTFPVGKNIVRWEWYWGDGTFAIVNAPASPNLTHTFPALGPYTVELKVTNTSGCVDSTYHSVSLTASPQSDFSYSDLCAGDTAKFQNHSKQNNGPPFASYYWNYGDIASGNNVSFLVNGAHVYADSGFYTVTLAVANTAGCPDTIRKQIHIRAKPAVGYNWNVGAMNNEIDFHIDSLNMDLPSIGYMCLWNFGDGTFGFGHNPVHTYLGSNNWTATLTVTDTNGCSNSISHVVYVPEIPMAFYSSNSPVCLNTLMCFTNLSTVPSPPFGFIASWVWNFGDGTPQDTIFFPDDPSPCHMYANPGTYLVTLTVTDNFGFTDSYSHDQIVLPLPIANFYYTTTCVGSVVQFTDGSFPNGGGNIISHEWLFDDPLSGANNTSLQTNPTHIFTHGGLPVFNVRLIVTNFDNCVDTMIKQVYVNPLPTVDFTRDTACLNELVHFQADLAVTHPDSLVTWQWNFGDGAAIDNTPIATSHLYTAPNTYIASLTVIDIHGCVNTVSHQVKVNPLPLPEFSWTTPACTSSPISYTDQSTVPAGYSGYIVKWQWDFNDGSPVQTILSPAPPNIIHTFLTGGTSHTVRLTVWTNDSCSQFREHTINSVTSPTANFSYSTTTCQGQSVLFTDLSQTNGGGSISIWNWNFGDPGSGWNNTSTAQNPLHTYTVAGTYVVTLIINNSTGCTDTIADSITIGRLPVANFTDDTVCLNNPTHFTDLSNPILPSNLVSWSWNFGDGSPLNTQQNPTHTYTSYGVKTVTLTVVNSKGCTKDTSRQILVNPLPIPEFSFSSPNCVGAVVTFTDHSNTVSGYLGSIIQWVWDFNDGSPLVTVNAPGNPNVTHTFAVGALNHLVRLTIMTTDSCTAYIEHLVTSIPAPVAYFSFPGPNCANETVQFTDLSQANGGGLITTWSWNFDDPPTGTNNFATSQNPSHTFSGPGNYLVSLIVTNTSGCQDTIAQNVIVDSLPLANFTATPGCMNSLTTFTSTSIAHATSIISYTWDFGDSSPVSHLQNPTYTYTTYGTFTVHLTVVNSNGCVKDTSKQIMIQPLPLPAFTYTTPNCLGAPVQYTNQSTTVPGYLGYIVRWTWDFGDGSPLVVVNYPGNPNVTHVFLGGSSAHTVTLTVKTTDSCSATISHIVNSIPSPIASFAFPTSDCAQQSVQFTDLSQPNGGGNVNQWYWDFGDPGSGTLNHSTLPNPTHSFNGGATATVYIVKEIVYNASNCTDTSVQNITIIPKPVANFTYDTICLGSLTSFRDTSTAVGTITQWDWQFGDGQTGTGKDVTHLYASSGVFAAILTVTTAEGCMGTITKSVLVLPKPVASFTTTAPTCAADSVYFTDLSSTPHGFIATWLWDFGDGNTTTINYPAPPNVYHIYAAGNTYTVTLTITTSDNCTDVKSTPVVIQPAPLANFDYAPTRCALMPVQFNDISQTGGGSPISQWLWNFGDLLSGSANTSTLKNPTHSFSGSGPFTVSLRVTSATGCSDTTGQQVTINAAPVALFSSDTACVGSLTHFTDLSTPNATSMSSWSWNFGDPGSGTNNVSTLQNPSHLYSASGPYPVTLTVINSNSCSHDTIIMITVNPKPTAMFSADVSCVGDSTAFTDLSIAPGSSISTWNWDFGDGSPFATIQNPKHVYATASTFNVTLRVTNLSGCPDSITIPIITRPTPVAAFTFTSFFCPAGQVVFQDQSHGVGSAIVTREWIFEPGYMSNEINPTFTFGKTDSTYSVCLIVTDSYGCKDTICDSVYVKPGFAFDFRNDTVCFNNPTHFTAIDKAKGDSLYNIYWNFGDVPGPLNQAYTFNATHIFTHAGTFSVRLRVTDSDNCTDSIVKQVVVHALPVLSYRIISTPCDSVIHFRDSTYAGDGATISSWQWNFGDGSPNLIIPSPGPGDTSHIYLNEGVYPIHLTVTNNFGCVDTLSKTAELYPCILASFSHADTLCARYIISFSDSSLPVSIINQWHWIFGDGLDTTYTTHAGSIHHTYGSPGTYIVQLIIHATVSGSGRTFIDTTRQAVVIHPTPLPSFSNTAVCYKQLTLFKDTSDTYGEPTTTWNWDFGQSGAANTSTIKDPTHRYDSAGTFNVKMVVMNRFGCKDSITKQTRVFQIPTAEFVHTNPCAGNPTYFTDTSVIGDTASLVYWNWKFGETGAKKDTSLQRDPIHQYKTAGSYNVQLIVKDQHGCYDTVDSTVLVHVTPLSSFTYTDYINNMPGKLLMNNKSVDADTYYWDFGNGQNSTDENPVVTYSADGTYLIMLVSSNTFNCTDTTYYRYEILFKGLFIPNAFAPTSGNEAVSGFKPIGINLKQFKIDVYDTWGHLLWTSTELDPMGRPTGVWDGRDTKEVLLPEGTYLWKASATFIDNTIWQGSDIGKGDYKTSGTVTLIR